MKVSGSGADDVVAVLVELIRRASSSLPKDVEQALAEGAAREQGQSALGEHALRVVLDNVELAREGVTPMCQDTGVMLFEVDLPVGEDPRCWRALIERAVERATQEGMLRQNTIDSIDGSSVAGNVAAGAPQVHTSVWDRDAVRVRVMLKGGGL